MFAQHPGNEMKEGEVVRNGNEKTGDGGRKR